MATQEDKTNTGVLATVVVVGAIAMISVSSMLAAMVRQERTQLDSVRPEHADLETVSRLRAEQRQALNAAPQWKDRAAGRVTVPIDRAKELVLAQYKADPESASPEPPPGLIMNPGATAAPGTTVPGVVAPAAVPGAPAPVGDGQPGAGAATEGGVPTKAPGGEPK